MTISSRFGSYQSLDLLRRQLDATDAGNLASIQPAVDDALRALPANLPAPASADHAAQSSESILLLDVWSGQPERKLDVDAFQLPHLHGIQSSDLTNALAAYILSAGE